MVHLWLTRCYHNNRMQAWMLGCPDEQTFLNELMYGPSTDMRDRLLHHIICASPRHAFYYASNILNHSWPSGEDIIATDAYYSYQYALDVLIKHPFPKGEPVIAASAEYSYWYAANVLCKRFYAGEPAIVTDPMWAYWYAVEIIKRRFPMAEETIKQDAKWAYWYARHVLKHRWNEAEGFILQDEVWGRHYQHDVIECHPIEYRLLSDKIC